jgi:hypothetical protein
MSRLVRKTFSLPEELSDDLERTAMARGLSASAVATERLRDFQAAQQQVVQSLAELAQARAHAAALEADLATRPPRDFRDSKLNLPPGMSKLIDDLQRSEKQGQRLKADAADAMREAEAWRKSSAVWEGRCEAARREVASAEERNGRLLADLRQHRIEMQSLEEQACKREGEYKAALEAESTDSLFKGFGCGTLVALVASCFIGFLVLLLWPADSWPMRFVATTAMGAMGDPERAAVRLHGAPLAGVETQFQLYALLQAQGNEQRLKKCLDAVNRIRPGKGRQWVPCTLRMPREVELQSAVVQRGPFDLPRPLRRLLRRNAQVTVTLAEQPD